MSTKLVALFAVLLFLSPLLQAQIKPVPVKSGRAHPTQILARYAEGASASARATVLAAEGVQVKRQFPRLPGLVLLGLNEDSASAADAASPEEQGARLMAKIARLQATGLFRYVEPDYIQTAAAVPTDASFTDGTLWGLRNTGQASGVSGADIDAVRAWDLTTGSTDVIVAVIDTGIRYTHQDLAAQMWRNPGEIAGNGVDDDQDGYVDNVFGINAINGSGDPMDEDDHGTHCAGTIGAAANDGHPHVGVAWQVRLMACKFLGPDGGTTSDAIRCVSFAVSKGARILSNSWGGGGFSQGLLDAIADARDSGVLFVAAAGNESSDTDTGDHYPSNYDVENVISVAALDRQDKLADFSNYGADTVDLGAPGVAIYSSTSGSDSEYKLFNGTSMATPHVSGVAALVAARFPDISLAEMRQRLIGTVVPVAALRGRTVTGGRVNAYNAVNATPDGTLEVTVAATGGDLIGGRTATLLVRVTDLFSVLDATVAGTVTGFPALQFRNDGVAPDAVAGDGTYSASFNVPTDRQQITLNVDVTAPGKQPGTAEATFDIVLPPANDQFADATALAGDIANVTGTNRGATKETGEPAHAGNAGGRSVWWTWTAPFAGVVTLHTDGSDFDTTLAVYAGTAVNALGRLASDDDSGQGVSSRLTFSAAAGSTYRIAVDGYDGRSGAIQLSLRLGTSQAAPANDSFANRTVLTGANVTATAATLGASREAGEPNHAGNPGGRSVWWSWTAPATGEVVMHTEGSDFDTVLAVYTGGAVNGLTLVAEDNDSGEGTQSRLVFAATAGTSYRIAVDGFDGTGGSARLSVVQSTANPAPPNDAFAARSELSGSTPTANGSNVEASKEAGEPSHADNAGGSSVWWTWTLPSDGEVVIHTTGSGFDTLLAVYTGDTVEGLALVAQNDQDPAGGITSRVAFTGVAGTTYQIVVDGANTGFGAATGSIVLTAAVGSISGAPPNDLFANRITLSGEDVRVDGFNFGATAEPGEPFHVGLGGIASVWWTWTAPADLSVTLDTAGSDFDTLLAVYTGDSPAALSPIAGNDDGPTDRTSQLRFNAQAGVTYQIVVDGYLGSTGNISLGLRAVPGGQAPPNDLFADREALAGSSVGLTATSEGAAREPGEPFHAGDAGGASVWWSWTPAETGVVTITTDGSEFDTLLAVYTGTDVGGLTVVASDDDGGAGTRSRVVFQATAGTEYQIAVDGYGGEFGSIVLSLEQSIRPPPANDAFANRSLLSGASVSVTGYNVGASKEPGEPGHAGESGGQSVWWRWTAPASGEVVIHTTGSNFDTLLAVYQGNVVGALTLVAANDDDEESQVALTSRVRFDAVAGTEYQIAVDGYEGEGGDIRLSLLSGDSNSNDDFENAIVIEGLNVSVTGSNAEATKQAGEPDHAGNVGGQSVWWRWTAPASLAISVTAEGSDFDTLLGVYAGSSLASLTVLDSNDDSGRGVLTSAATFNATAGTTYYFAVDGYAESGVVESGSITLNLLSLAEAADSTGLAWAVSGNGERWHAQRETSHDSQDALKSGFVSDNQSSTLQTTVTGPGTLRFWWKVSSEVDFDYLVFRFDGTELAAITGDVNWEMIELDVPAGQHSLTWVYEKDESERAGSDAGWVDQVTFSGGGEPMTAVLRDSASGPGGFRFVAQVEPGREYRVLAVDDFGQWTEVGRFTSTGAEFEFTDPAAASLPLRFYRVVTP